MEKDIRLGLTIKNNLLLSKILKLSKTVNSFCRENNFAANTIGELINFKASPVVSPKRKNLPEQRRVYPKENLFWRKPVWKLALFLGCLPSELFPPHLWEPRQNRFELETCSENFLPLHENKMMIDISKTSDIESTPVPISEVMSCLTPREEYVVTKRFGLNQNIPQTYQWIALNLGVSRQRTRQIEAKALRKLRHPKYSKKLKGFL